MTSSDVVDTKRHATHRHTEAVEEVVESDDEVKTSYACCCVCRGVRGRLMVACCCWGVMVVVGGCLVLLSHKDNILWLRELTDKDYRHKGWRMKQK